MGKTFYHSIDVTTLPLVMPLSVNDLSGEHFDNGGQIQLAIMKADIRDISNLHFIGC